MQDWNGCADLEQDNGSNGDRISITLTDKRDGNEYTVAKLKDGKCWMTQNLRIYNKTISKYDSDIELDTFIIPTSDSTVWGNRGEFNVSRVYMSSDATRGGLYTWFLATAGEGTSQVLSKQGSVNHSICPKGWTIPSKNILEALVKNYDGTSALKEPINLVQMGQYTSGLECTPESPCGGNTNRTSVGKYWGNWADNYQYAGGYSVSTSSGSNYFGIGVGNYADSGYGIRCVKR